MNSKQLLRQFATTDGLLRGTALVSSVTSLAAIALIQGFGPSAILFSSFIQLLANGLLEVPTGWLSDRFGWARTLIAALSLKFVVTSFMILAVIAAALGHVGLAWSFIACEAFLDAIACSLMNGPYQSAYLEWYRMRTDGASKKETVPLLFLESFRYSQFVRLLLPILIVGIVSILRWKSGTTGEMSVVTSSLLGLSFVLILRCVILARAYFDLKEQILNDRKIPFSYSSAITAIRMHLRNDLIQLKTIIDSSWDPFVLYLLSRLLNVSAGVFLIGYVMKQFVVVFNLGSFGWSGATMLAVGFYSSETIVSSFLFSRISVSNFHRIMRTMGTVSVLSGLLHFALVAIECPISGLFWSLLFFAVMCLLTGAAAQRYVASNFDTVIPVNMRSTWLSVSESLAMLSYCGITGLAMTRSAESVYLTVVGYLIFATLLILLFANRRLFQVSNRRTFSQVIRSHFFRAVFVGAVIFSSYDLFSYVHSTTELQRESESKLGQLILSSIREPLIQGSFTEANLRLSKMEVGGTFLCSQFSIWDFSQNSCDMRSDFRLFFRDIQFPISLDSKDLAPIGTLTIRFSHIQMILEISKRIIMDIFFFGLLSFIAFKISRRIGSQLECELDQVVQIAERNLTKENPPLKLTTLEFQRLSDKFHELIRFNEENTKKLTLGKIALQVAHDIRSPLSSMSAALEGFVNIKSSDPKYASYLNLLELSTKRLKGIADGLLEKRDGGKEKGSVLFSLHHILDTLIGEYQVQDLYNDIIFEKRYISQSIQLHGDPTRLQRAFGNMVKNAVEAMNKKGRITITTELKDAHAIVSMADTGPGMSSETLKKVLQGGYTQGKRDGHGIGMQVVREVVEQFNGELSASSGVDEGTTFELKLPLPSKDLITTATRDETALEKFEIISKLSFPILVVDDDPSMRELWKIVLEEQGIIATLCESYEQVELTILDSMSTAIVDYHYDNSVHNGADVIRYLKEKGLQHLYLCTAEYWKPEVKRLTEEFDIKVCPKPLPKITICHSERSEESRKETKRNPSSFDKLRPQDDSSNGHGLSVLVIDDDPGIRLSWKVRQEMLKIRKLQAYSSMEACVGNGVDYTNIDIAFIDKNVPETTWSLDRTITHLKSHGVKKIVIASGESSADLKKDVACQQADYILSEKIPKSLEPFRS